MARSNPREFPINMSLRLRSDQVPMKPLVTKMDFEVRHLHEMGQPIARVGRLRGRVADRHYASLAHAEGNDSDVGPWLNTILAAIASHPTLCDYLRSGEVTATAWIVIFGNDERKPPEIPAEIVAAATRSHLTLFVENYTSFDSEGIPEKLWLNGTEAQKGGGE